MDGLDEFEKQLAADKAQREKTKTARSRQDGNKHKHRHGHADHQGHRRRHRAHDDDDDDDPHHRHHKRRRSSRDDADKSRSRHANDRPDEKAGLAVTTTKSALVRDAWMTGPSTLEIEHIHRPSIGEKTSITPRQTPKEQAQRTIHAREINCDLEGQQTITTTTTTPTTTTNHTALNPATSDTCATTLSPHRRRQQQNVDYIFGDVGSGWRMTKLRGVYTMAQETNRPVAEIALQRFGSLRAFDDAREEEQELVARRAGRGSKEKPTGDLYRERHQAEQEAAKTRAPSPSGSTVGEPPAITAAAAIPVTRKDQTALNRLRAQMMKAKLRRAPNAAQLEEEYNRAAAVVTGAADDAPPAVVLGGMESRLLAGRIRNEVKTVDTKRGRERGTVVANDDMTVDDMLREERRTKGQAGGEGMRLAERIAKDARFDADLEYMDENAEKLARHVHKSEMSLKNMAAHEFQQLRRALDNCPLCHDDQDGNDHTEKQHQQQQRRRPLAPVIALGTRVFLTLPTEPEVSPGGAVIVPTTHRRNLLECDDDEWEEIRNFMKALTRMYHAQGRDVLFYENAAAAGAAAGRLHAAMVAAPIPYEQGAMAPAYFREAMLSADEEWSQHRKIIDTGAAAAAAVTGGGGLGRMAFRRSLVKELPYFHVWFSLDGGLGHIVEDAGRWPRGDLFAREVVGGIVGAEPHVIRKQGRWQHRASSKDGSGDARTAAFKKDWRRYDWTRVLVEEAF